MKSFLRNALLVSAFTLVATGTASANQMLMFVTAGQILDAVTNSTFGGNCGTADLVNCGVYAVGVQNGGVSLTSGTFSGSTSTAATGYSSPVPTGTASWVAVTLAGGYRGFEAGGSAAGNTQQQFITSNNTVKSSGSCTSVATAGCYDANVNSSVLKGIAAMNSTTQIGFLLTFANNVAAGTTANISLELLGVALSGASPALEGAKGQAGFITLSGTLVPTPEPSSIGLALVGLSGLALAARKRMRKNS